MAIGVWTVEEYNSLRAAVASGVLTVTYSGPPSRTVTYQSLSAMRSLLAEMVISLDSVSGTRKNYRLAATRKGV